MLLASAPFPFLMPMFPVSLHLFTKLVWLVWGIYFVYRQTAPQFKYLAIVYRPIRQLRCSSVEVEIYDLNTVTAVNGPQWEHVKREMEDNGFQWIGDYISNSASLSQRAKAGQTPPIADPIAPPLPKPGRFNSVHGSRVFVHLEQQCLGKVTINVLSDSRGIKPTKYSLSVTILSVSGQGKHAWSYITTRMGQHEKISLTAKLLRHPRCLKTLMREATVTHLLEKHLERREKIASSAGISWRGRLSLEDCVGYEKNAADCVVETAKRLTPLKMAWQAFWLQRERDGEMPEWLGELKGRL